MRRYYARLLWDAVWRSAGKLSRIVFLVTLAIALAGLGVPMVTNLSLPPATSAGALVPLVLLTLWDRLGSNYRYVENLRTNLEGERAEHERTRLKMVGLVERQPNIRVGFVAPSKPQELLDAVTVYPWWPDGTDHLSTNERLIVRVYNHGTGSARNVLMTFGLPARVWVHSATGLPFDLSRLMDSIQHGTRHVLNPIPTMHQGTVVDTEFMIAVRVELTNFRVTYSVAMEDQPAVSGELRVEVSQMAIPTGVKPAD